MALTDFIYCTNIQVMIDWGRLHYPDDDGLYGSRIPPEVATGWLESPTYPQIQSGEDEDGIPVYIRDPDRSDFLVACKWLDMEARASLEAEQGVVLHDDLTLDEIRALYPDHAANNNTIAHVAE